MAERKRIKKTQNTTKKAPSRTTKSTTKSETKSEIITVTIVFVCLILILSYFSPWFGNLGKILRGIGLGFFGYVGFFIPLFCSVMAVHYFAKGTLKPYRYKYVLFVVSMVCASAFWTLITDKLHPGCFDSFLSVWDCGKEGIGGGLFGTVALFIKKWIGTVGTGITLVFGFIISLIVVTGTAPFHALYKKINDREEKYQKRLPIEEAMEKQEKAPKKKPLFELSKKEKQQEEPEKELQKEILEEKEPDLPQDDIKINLPKEVEIFEEDKKPENEEKVDNSPVSIEDEIQSERIEYTYPPIDLLEAGAMTSGEDRNEDLRTQAKKLTDTLLSFGVEAKVLEVSKGPSVTRFEISPSAGVKVSKIVNLADDIALNLAAYGVRIEAPIPGKAAVGIEIPNSSISSVRLREVIESKNFGSFSAKTAFALGKDISGEPIVADIAKMPHLLIAGATGSGKSVCINSLITSILYKADPNEVKLIMVDPKVVELSIYNGIPHLLIPVVTDPRRAAGSLNWAVQEMPNRYNLFADANVRDILGYNEYAAINGERKLEQIIIIIDELSDLMMVAPRDVEDAICRLAQMARAAGMHLIIATQRPSVDVITGVIKANIPSRIAFAVSSQIDSRTILDMGGAEKLLGKGDMLYLPMGASKPKRIQGCFISDKEVERVVDFVKECWEPNYDEEIIQKINNDDTAQEVDDSEKDQLFDEAVKIVVEAEQASASLLQRKLKVGYSRAGRLIDQLEERQIIGPHEGSKPRKVLISRQEFYEMMTNDEE